MITINPGKGFHDVIVSGKGHYSVRYADVRFPCVHYGYSGGEYENIPPINLYYDYLVGRGLDSEQIIGSLFRNLNMTKEITKKVINIGGKAKNGD